MKRKLTSILAMDVAGYSQAMERDEAATLARLKELRSNVIGPRIDTFSGRQVKLMGDGALYEFASVVDALGCAIELQTALRDRNATLPETEQLHFRAGLHLGDVITDGGDIYGDGVNVAARLEEIAQPGNVVLSKQVHDQINGTVRADFLPLGQQKIKGLSRPIEAYQVDFVLARPVATHVITFGDYELDPNLFELRKSGAPVTIEPQALELLILMAQNPGKLVTKDEIFAKIWDNRIVSDSALSSQIKAARKAIGDSGSAQSMIATVHGRGFRFVAPLSQSAPDPSAPKPEPNPIANASLRPSVAILPFQNMNRDSTEDFLADGITEDITIAVSKNRWLTVVARNPAFSFRGSSDRLRDIGGKLQAQYLVTGSVRKAGDRFRITCEMVDAETEISIWSERFDRQSVDIFDLQDDISEMIAARIEAELGMAEQKKAERVPRQNLGAWQIYQLGVSEFYKFTPEANQTAQGHFRRAIEIDPGFGAAYSRLAYAIILNMVYFDADATLAAMDEALDMAQRAIRLDDQDANGYFTIGRVHLARKEYGLAIEALEHAVELNPCLAVVYCGLGDSLAYEGRLDEAIEQFENAIRLSPHDPFRWAFFSYRSLAHLFRGEYGDAAAWARRAIRVPNAQYWARAHLVAALGYLEDPVEIAAAREDLLALKPGFTINFARQHMFYLKLEDQRKIYFEGLARAGIETGGSADTAD